MHWHIVETKEDAQKEQLNIYAKQYDDYNEGCEVVKQFFRDKRTVYRGTRTTAWLKDCDLDPCDVVTVVTKELLP